MPSFFFLTFRLPPIFAGDKGREPRVLHRVNKCLCSSSGVRGDSPSPCPVFVLTLRLPSIFTGKKGRELGQLHPVSKCVCSSSGSIFHCFSQFAFHSLAFHFDWESGDGISGTLRGRYVCMYSPFTRHARFYSPSGPSRDKCAAFSRHARFYSSPSACPPFSPGRKGVNLGYLTGSMSAFASPQG